MVYVEVEVGSELDCVEGVHVSAGGALTEVVVEAEPKLSRPSPHGQLLSSEQLEVFIFASGVEDGHLGLNGEDEAFT